MINVDVSVKILENILVEKAAFEILVHVLVKAVNIKKVVLAIQ